MFENPNLIPRILRRQESQENSASYCQENTIQDPIFIELQIEVVTSHLNGYLQNSIQSELTSKRTPNLCMITTASPSSPSAPQATPSTPPSTTHIPIVIPSPPVVTSISATMAN